MSVKFVQDVEVTSGKIELTNQTANEIVCSGNLDLISDDNTNDTLDLGTTTQSWKGVNINTGSLSIREQSGTGFVNMTPSTNLVHVNTGGGYKVTGGTSSQFLKADGSVDSTTYATGTIPTDFISKANGGTFDDIVYFDSDAVVYGDLLVDGGRIDLNSGDTIINVTDPTNAQDVATKNYVDTNIPTLTSELTNDSSFVTNTGDFVSASGGTQDIDGLKTFTSNTVFEANFGNLNTTADTGVQFEVGTTAMNTMRTDADAFRIYMGGSTGVGTVYEVSQLGEHQWDGSGGGTRMKLDVSGNLHCDGDVTAYSTSVSDISMKDNVETIENATETVKQLRGVSYTWNKGHRKGLSEIGVIAQEVEKILPDLVHDKELLDGSPVKTVDYQKMIGLLIESNKELSDRLDKLEGCSCKK
jgi:hypothetical protein